MKDIEPYKTSPEKSLDAFISEARIMAQCMVGSVPRAYHAIDALAERSDALREELAQANRLYQAARQQVISLSEALQRAADSFRNVGLSVDADECEEEIAGLKERYCWVIEGAWSPTSEPDYWAGSSFWSSDPDRALRFATEKSAKQAAELMLNGINVRICEHGFAS